jgi:hypothetical protein
MVNERRWLILIFSLYFLLAFGYSMLMPIWESPDEPTHYHLALSFARKGEFPTSDKNYEAHQPRLYYYIAATGIRLLDKVDPKFSNYYLPKIHRKNLRVPEPRYEWNSDTYRFLLGAYMLRWLGILFGGIALWLNWKTFSFIEDAKPNLRIAALALAALTPQYLHIMASVNNDTLGTLAGALLFYLAVRALKTGSTFISVLSVFLAILFPLTIKVIVFPVGLAVLITLTWSQLMNNARKKQLLIIAGLLSGTVIITLVMYLLFPESMKSVANEITWRLFSVRDDAFEWSSITFILSQIIWTYWGKVGWLAIGLPGWLVIFLTAFGFIGFLLSARQLIKQRDDLSNSTFWRTAWLVALLTIAAVVKNGLTTIASQGRFLFPAIGALSLLMVYGWYQIFSEKIQNRLPMIVTVFMVSCNLIVWQFAVLPIYFQPFLD